MPDSGNASGYAMREEGNVKPSSEGRGPLRQANLRLHERVDSLGRPQQRGSRRAVKRQLMAAVEQGMTEPRELALDEASAEKAEAAKRAEGVVVAQRYQRAEVMEAEGRQRLALLATMPSDGVSDATPAGSRPARSAAKADPRLPA